MESRLMIVGWDMMVVTHEVRKEISSYSGKEESHHWFQAWPRDIRITAIDLRGREPFEFFKLRMEEWDLQDQMIKDGELTSEDYQKIRKQIWG